MKLSRLLTLTFLVVLFVFGVWRTQATNANNNNTGATRSQPANRRVSSNRQTGNTNATTNTNVNTNSNAGGNANSQGITEQEVNALKQSVSELEKKGYLSTDDLGLFYWLPNQIVLMVIGGLILLALLLHLLHLFRTRGLNRDVEQLTTAYRGLAQASHSGTTPGKNPTLDKFSEQMNQQSQGFNLLVNRISQMEGRFTAYDGQFRDAAQAVALTANWVGQAQLREVLAANGGSLSESDRAATIRMLERYEEPLRLNASRVEAVSQALAEVVERLESRMQSSSELAARIQNLYEGIGTFDQHHKRISDELSSLRRGSFAQRSSALHADQERLFDQVNNGSLSAAQMVERSRVLVEHQFPQSPGRSEEAMLPLAERESHLKRVVREAPDYLMNWYDNLLQLQNQLDQSQRTPSEAESAHALAKVQQFAREALGKFDIQPEAIQIGQTNYDRRLHDAALVRQAAQYPINTIVEVHKCGFRRMSSGEVLRRPQVVVAGATAT